MAVYVDKEQNPFRGMLMCHMLADSLEELHAMAERIGMKRAWYQPKSTPHYDLCQDRRRLAIAYGAVEIDRVRTVEIIHQWRARADQG